uniref:Endonuclease/exonuclease/phosphatase domain-containing protein n=1 Tax=Myripristis murdjan TaxID=586833 RepID=A0A668ASQ0_9TELE
MSSIFPINFSSISRNMGLRFLSVNVRGVNIPHKRTSILGFLQSKAFDFAFIQESHLLKQHNNLLANKHYRVLASSTATSKSKGVAILAKRRLRFDFLGEWSDKAGRIAIAKIRDERGSRPDAERPISRI